jgi:RNA 3'-terminal phosphate cyclase-like protein
MKSSLIFTGIYFTENFEHFVVYLSFFLKCTYVIYLYGCSFLTVVEHEADFIWLLDKITNGSIIEVNETGTKLYYNPGILEGGSVEHQCSHERSIGYYLEPLIMLAPFAKKPISITLKGITNGLDDPSVDYYRLCTLPLLKKILPNCMLTLKVTKRGFPPHGEGEATFSCSVVKYAKPILLVDPGKVSKIRGLVYTAKVAPTVSAQVIHGARGILNNFLSDVYIYTDNTHKEGKSRGYGILLVCESTTGVNHAVELCTSELNVDSKSLPEENGSRAAQLLLEEVLKGGCTGSVNQCLVLLFMALGQRDVSKVQLGELSEYTICFMRNMKTFFGVVYKLDSTSKDLPGEMKQLQITVSCLGVGFANLAKGIL